MPIEAPTIQLMIPKALDMRLSFGATAELSIVLFPNGLRYLRVGECGQCLEAGKTRSEKNA